MKTIASIIVVSLIAIFQCYAEDLEIEYSYNEYPFNFKINKIQYFTERSQGVTNIYLEIENTSKYTKSPPVDKVFLYSGEKKFYGNLVGHKAVLNPQEKRVFLLSFPLVHLYELENEVSIKISIFDLLYIPLYIKNLRILNSRIISWDEYYKKNRKNTQTIDIDSIKLCIKSKVEKWQEKSEFETLEAWHRRVNDKTRSHLLDSLSSDFQIRLNTQIEEIKREQEELYEKYKDFANSEQQKNFQIRVKEKSKEFSKEDLKLNPYDAEHETFLIHGNYSGDILLPVPIDEAPSFKQNWESIKLNIEPIFVPYEDDLALSKLIFKNNDKEYVYDSHTQANYTINDIDYNFSPLEVADIKFNDGQFNNIAPIPEIVPSAMVEKNSSDVLIAQKAQIDRVKITISEKSDVDTSIPRNKTDNNTNTFVVIIANENYHSVSNVPYASKDGEVLEKYLTRTVGIPNDHVKIYKNASFGNMAAALKHIENLSEAFGKELNLIFYYAGHGMPDEKTKNPMLIPVDGDIAIPETCYELNKVISTLGGLNANSVLVMLDACFSGTQRGDEMLMTARGIRIKSNQSEPIGNMVILSASQGDETAYPYEKEQHGLFTYFLLKKLQENNGDVTLGELADYITEQVKRQSVVSNGRLQTPAVAVSPSFQSQWRTFKIN